MIIFLSGPAVKELKRIGDELGGIRAATERIAAALEIQPEPREPADVRWHNESPEGED